MESPVALSTSLQQQLDLVRERRAFNVEEWVDKKSDMLNEYMKKSGLKACLVSVSGGIDSAVTYALLLKAQTKQGSPIEKVYGVAQPIHSTSHIWQRALELETLGGTIVTVDQTPVYDQLTDIVAKATNITGNQFSKGQLKSYMRTPVGYYVAQLLSQEGTPCIVVGTGNKDEDGYLCYFCKAGDGVCDVQLIADLHKSEVFTVGRYLNVPQSILNAAPSADLWEGQTDENELGFTYDFVELYTEYMAMDEEVKKAFAAGVADESEWTWFQETGKKADAVHARNKHKLNFPLNLNVL